MTVLEHVLALCWISPADGEKARWIIRCKHTCHPTYHSQLSCATCVPPTISDSQATVHTTPTRRGGREKVM
ncbi:hypothetical protein GGR56DRAFT_645458 [Xylariaceae sp. FL0804]|nr:hypothetical protein GGR56DRAFT_645458 [Xylariaceae sp. FL0804]